MTRLSRMFPPATMGTVASQGGVSPNQNIDEREQVWSPHG